MTLRDGRIGANINDIYGGGIWITDSSLTLTNVVISNNTARFVSTNPPAQFGYGGAIASFSSTLTIHNSLISSNSAPLTGGVYCRDDGFLNVSGSKFTTNSSTAIRLEGGQNLSVGSSRFEGNGSAVSASSFNRVIVVNSTITGNVAGIAIESGSELIVDRTVIENGNATSSPNASGGGIFNKGVATISNTRINNNSVSGDAGGVWNNGTMYLFACAITNNSALRSAGGIKNSGRLFLTNSTVSGNSADFGGGFGSSPGGGITNGSVFGGSILITNSTVANNRSTGHGGGIMHDNSGSVSIRNSIVASNHSNQSSHDVSGTFVSQGFNLVSNINGSTGWLGTDILNVNALLAPLGNNGGGTLTHALLPMSPAIDAGNDANAIDPTTSFAFSRDQRGEVRFLGSPNLRVDIGALESNLSSSPVSLSGRVLGSNGAGISKARLNINNNIGGVIQAMTSSLGYYKFENLTPGTTYTITVVHKNYQFPSPQSITIENNRSDLDFVANP
ncbi:MAG TPA: choice-of-anchor Q domain-containing protein [Pyrinomonadaceae bacterium]|nr:choice-of-anchor Q domain-containing protein [Pyrinomonadaceae bacterium]